MNHKQATQKKKEVEIHCFRNTVNFII